MATETVKVFEEKDKGKKAVSPWAWLLPLLLLLALGIWLLNRHPQQTAVATAPVADATKPDNGVGTKTASTWTAATIADSIRSKGRVDFNDNDVHFATASAALAGDSQAVLDETAQTLKSNGDWKMRVVGHTDSVGTDASNQQLAQQRAASVVTYLTAHGVDAGHLTTDAKGASQPVATNSTDAGRADNRRVEMIKQ